MWWKLIILGLLLIPVALWTAWGWTARYWDEISDFYARHRYTGWDK
jgi:hypothetical protein